MPYPTVKADDGIQLSFPNVNAFGEYAAAALVPAAAARGSKYHRYLYGDMTEFYSSGAGEPRGPKLLSALCGAGDPDSAGRVEKLYDAMRDALPVTPRPTFAPSVAGGRVDVPSFLANDPQCFRVRTQEPALTPVRMLVSFDRSWQIEPQTAERLGAAIAAAAITASAVRPVTITLVLIMTSTADPHKPPVTITIDIDTRSADVGTIALMLASASPVRRIGFPLCSLAWKHTPEELRGESYRPPDNLERLTRALDPAAVYVPRLTDRYWNDYTMAQWIDYAKKLLGEALAAE